jgi:Flp pilus assembly protein TadG
MISLCQTPKQQRGIVMVLYTVGMVAIIGMAGLALDMGHAFLNKTRLQNALDAGALSGASVLNDGLGVAAAETAALYTFNQHLTGELGTADPPLVPTVQFSTTLVPFVPGALDPDAPKYVRLIVADFSMSVWLAYILPGVGNTLTLGGSAVAGPQPLGSPPDGEVCDLAPFVVCAGTAPGGGYDTNCTDGNCYGYDVGTTSEIVLKTGSGGGGWEVGPGNYQLIQLNCGAGANCVRDNLAGKYPGCIINGDSVTTKPGNSVGPVAQGFNTRFGIYQGGMSATEYPPDVVTHWDSGFWYNDYLTNLNNGDYDHPPMEQGGNGVPMRRVLAVVFGDCSSTVNGQGDVPVVGTGCYFMTRPAEQNGQQRVYGQLVNGCRVSGDVAENPGPGSGGVIIVLYKDPDGGDS